MDWNTLVYCGRTFYLVRFVRLEYFEDGYECFSTLWIIHLIFGMSSDTRILFFLGLLYKRKWRKSRKMSKI